MLADAHFPGAPLTVENDKPDWAAPDEMRDRLFNAAATELRQTDDGFIAGVIWVQGEGDTFSRSEPDTYADRFAALIDEFEARITGAFPARDAIGDDGVAVAIAALSDLAPAAANRPNWDAIQAQQLLAAVRNGDFTLIDPDAVAVANGFTQGTAFEDELHYAVRFRPDLAEALIDAVIDDQAPKRISGGAGDDVIRGGARDELLRGVQGNDKLIGRGGDDVVIGGGGNDTLKGGRDGDILNDGAGRDLIVGGGGADYLTASRGADTLIGGAGADIFEFRAGGARDRIKDFNTGVDLIRINRNGVEFDDLKITDIAGGARIKVKDLDILVTTRDDLGEDDFLF